MAAPTAQPCHGVKGGATSVLDDKVTVLARFGTAVEDIDAEAVRAEADECKSAIAELEQMLEARRKELLAEGAPEEG